MLRQWVAVTVLLGAVGCGNGISREELFPDWDAEGASLARTLRDQGVTPNKTTCRQAVAEYSQQNGGLPARAAERAEMRRGCLRG